jgi:hypothetical protein
MIGMIIKLLIVEVTMPPITTIPSVLEMTVSALCENASGNKVRIVATAVIKIGRILERLPFNTASLTGKPGKQKYLPKPR